MIRPPPPRRSKKRTPSDLPGGWVSSSPSSLRSRPRALLSGWSRRRNQPEERSLPPFPRDEASRAAPESAGRADGTAGWLGTRLQALVDSRRLLIQTSDRGEATRAPLDNPDDLHPALGRRRTRPPSAPSTPACPRAHSTPAHDGTCRQGCTCAWAANQRLTTAPCRLPSVKLLLRAERSRTPRTWRSPPGGTRRDRRIGEPRAKPRNPWLKSLSGQRPNPTPVGGAHRGGWEG